MKTKLLPFLALLPLFAPSFSAATEAPATPIVADDDTPLGECMDAINKAMRGMRRKIGEAENFAECLKAVQTIQAKSIEAKGYDPVKLAEAEGDEAKAKFRMEYRMKMHEFLNRSFELEVALMKGDVEAVGKAYKALVSAKRPAHKAFKAKTKKD